MISKYYLFNLNFQWSFYKFQMRISYYHQPSNLVDSRPLVNLDSLKSKKKPSLAQSVRIKVSFYLPRTGVRNCSIVFRINESSTLSRVTSFLV